MYDRMTRTLMLLLTIAAITFAIVTTLDDTYAATGSADETATSNPLLAKWEGPYGGVPPFDRVQVALFKPALESAMAEQLAEVDRIAKNTAVALLHKFRKSRCAINARSQGTSVANQSGVGWTVHQVQSKRSR